MYNFQHLCDYAICSWITALAEIYTTRPCTVLQASLAHFTFPGMEARFSESHQHYRFLPNKVCNICCACASLLDIFALRGRQRHARFQRHGELTNG